MDSLQHGPSPLGRAFTHQSDLLPVYLLRFDRANTRKAYRRDLERFFGSSSVTLDLARAVTFPDVNRYIETLEAAGRSPATIRRNVVSLRGFFAWLVALGMLPLNPADRQLVRKIAAVRPQDRHLTVLTRDEAARLVAAVDLEKETGPRDRALVLTLLHCVLRRSEAAAMDFEHLRAAGPYWVLSLPATKGGADQSVKVPLHVVEAIDSVREAYGYSGGPIWRSFSNNSSRGRRLSPSSVYTIVSRLARSASIHAPVGAHTLRHTGCTLAIENGASIQQVQTHARHKNVETTMMYLHQRDRLADSAADYIDI